MHIELTPYEIMAAAQAGVMRQVQNLKKDRKPYHGIEAGFDWQYHIEGCLGEMALAKFLNIYWSGKGEFRGADVGNYQVRTAAKKTHRLILHPDDPDDAIFWLVCGLNGEYDIMGWIKGIDGKKQEYWKDPAGGRPAFFVPHLALLPVTWKVV